MSYVEDLFSLTGKTAVVTGAGRGLGRAIARSQPLLEYEDAAWDETLSVNLDALFRLAPVMPKGGSIINITSIAAELAGNNPAYGAAKGGLKQLTKVLANALAAHGIWVNAIGPGYFLTDLGGSSGKDPEQLAQQAASTMFGRLGEPEDLAGIAIVLASDASGYVTGQDFYVDGGGLAKM